MTQALATITPQRTIVHRAAEPQPAGALAPAMAFDDAKVDLLKRTICKGATDDELQLFLHACRRSGLDPFMRQIHAVKRWDNGREVMAIQTGIDGYRLVADRTGRYMPGRDAEFEYDEDGRVVKATAFVKKMDAAGEWHEVAASARFDEYVGTKRDGSPNRMWSEKPHIMLSKCAEALALRRAFPAELSGIYTREEMEQADNPPPGTLPPPPQSQGPARQPDLSDDAHFLARWSDAMAARGFTPERAREVLDDRLKEKGIALADMHVKNRAAALSKARKGGYDEFLPRQPAEGEDADQGEDAASDDDEPEVPPITDALLEDWDAFADEFVASAVRAGSSGDPHQAADLGSVAWESLSRAAKVRRKADPEQLTHAQRRELLEAVRAGAFDFATGKVNQVAQATAAAAPGAS